MNVTIKCNLFIFILSGIFIGVLSQNKWLVAASNYAILYEQYYNSGSPVTDIIPVDNQDNGIEVTMSMTLDSLNGYDAVKGQIDVSGSISLEWMDESSQLINNYGSGTDFDSAGSDIIIIDPDKAWTPSLVLINAVDTVTDIGDTTYKLRYSISTGTVTWQPRVLLRASCTPDVTYYPFDRQSCFFTYTAWGFTASEIDLKIGTREWDISNYESNGVWDVISTSSTTYQSGGSTYAKFSIIIERQPLYFTFNIALPILLLGLLNGFVFLLQTTMAYLPEIASPMSLLCFYVIVMMVFSMVINILTILMLRVYHKPAKDKV